MHSLLLSTLFIIGLYSTAQAQQLRPFSCSDGAPKGIFCKNDLSGYVDCNLVDGKPSSKVTQCPTNAKCSCYINTACTEDNNEICKTKVTQPILPGSFFVDFNEQTNLSSPAGLSIRNYRKLIIQNTAKNLKTVKIWNTDTGMQEFVFVRPSTFDLRPSGGKFVQFSGSYPNKCFKSVLEEFPTFFPNFNLYQQTTADATTETWESKVGSRNPGQSSQTIEYVFNIDYNGAYTPKSVKAFFRGSIGQKFIMSTKQDIMFFVPEQDGYPGDAYFRQPGFCPPL